MGIESVVTDSDAESDRQKHDEKKGHLKAIQPEEPEIERDGSQRQCECTNEERTRCPVNAFEWEPCDTAASFCVIVDSIAPFYCFARTLPIAASSLWTSTDFTGYLVKPGFFALQKILRHAIAA